MNVIECRHPAQTLFIDEQTGHLNQTVPLKPTFDDILKSKRLAIGWFITNPSMRAVTLYAQKNNKYYFKNSYADHGKNKITNIIKIMFRNIPKIKY